MKRRPVVHGSSCVRIVATDGVLALAVTVMSLGFLRGHSQSTAPQSEQGKEAEKKSQEPLSRKPSSEKATPQGTKKLGHSLKLSESPAFREAPLTGGEGGGYSSAMSAVASAPSSATVEEMAMESLLLDSPRWRVGPHGLIERGEVGGAWTAVASGVTSDLYGVSFSNRWVGWVAGAAGTLLRTEDGGKTWRKVSFPGRADLVVVRAEDWKSARVTTRAGTVYVTADAGASWSTVPHH